MGRLEIKPAFEGENVAVAISVSNFYAPYAGVFLKSLVDHANSQQNYDVIILQRDLNFENKRLLMGMAEGFQNISIRIPNVDELFQLLEGCVEIDRFPVEIYARILVPYYLKGYEKIVITGVDTLLKSDIGNFYSFELEKDKCIGGVPDAQVLGYIFMEYLPNALDGRMTYGCYLQNVLHLKDLSRYINADFMLLNCKKYCEYICLNDLLQVIMSKTYALADQDVINTVFQDKIEIVNSDWNVIIPTSKSAVQAIEMVLQNGAWNTVQAYRDSKLLHWAGRPKPWICPDVPYGGEWWKTAMSTPFVGEIIARMQDGLLDRKKYYMSKYGAEVQAWDPAPTKVDRSGNYSGRNA